MLLTGVLTAVVRVIAMVILSLGHGWQRSNASDSTHCLFHKVMDLFSRSHINNPFGEEIKPVCSSFNLAAVPKSHLPLLKLMPFNL